ncbi:translation initiation factor IF-3 [candidate division WWE3 bacterium RIFCSPHIGHO2_01_FULL_40_23]|uniref:Translation initiation factor IF-3 n=1 Tax=candidate division WWE3 bacterium RIFCSPLOWO2_01_FULL_41_18 TaxID=1802625 RepID=A0A1F4VEL8_UNCKA|nr:MAG: translation initiation factor IF-3 [candidate division WWE3 bacterium RIFCSPHIGHO2_01_FULL_40_23]OGC55380.1 MAG: translation initiation factor IF-3 [candidate division WWE3 bacterium RIFCSPLOWO2_01_FULL_41_18]
MDTKRYFTNEKIRAQNLRIINSKGENIGVVTKGEALRMAREEKLDLVEIAPNANPPVAKILDFKKFLYTERKKASAARAHSKQTELKEFKFGPNIGSNDLNLKIGRAKEFLKGKNRVKFTVAFRGRENAHPEVGWEKIKKAISELSELGHPEADPRLVNKMISVTIVAS